MPDDITNPVPSSKLMQQILKRTQKFPSGGELDINKQLQVEMYVRFFPPIAWVPMDRAQTKLHKRYREAKDQIYKDPVLLPAFVELNPSKQLLGKMGIDEKRELLIRFSTVVLEALGFKDDDVKVGDKVVFDSIEYEIMTLHRDKYWANSNVAFELTVTLQKYRQGQ